VRFRQKAGVEVIAKRGALKPVLRALEGKVVNVEVKADDGDHLALAHAVAVAARAHRGRHRRFIVSSFEPRVLVHLRALAPEVERGLLLDTEPHEKARALAALAAVAPRAIHPHWSEGEARIRDLRAAGYDVHVWTVDHEPILRGLARAGATSVISNVPGYAREVLRG
jgi:glycerophosphoryl diester phosphodiesterase